MIFIICYSSGSYLFGIIASISATFSEILIQYSKVSIVDIPLTTFSLLFFTISVYYLKRSELSFRKLIVLSIIIGVSIAMKYTGALLVLPLFLIINKFLHQNKKFSGTKYFQIIFTSTLGLGFFFIWSILLVKEDLVLHELTALTTDGIIEIEYLNLLDNMFYIAFSLSLMLLFIAYLIFKDKINGLDTFISPVYLQSMGVVFFGFFLFSPYTIFLR